MAKPLPGRMRSMAAVWIGLSVISAPMTSMTVLGSNHTSASSVELTLGLLCGSLCFSSIFGSLARSSSVKPVPHLVTVSYSSSSGS